jgi:predicted DNA-binding protein|tara:strand:- start:979 stop:1173 length:195 start_codon:yes stop_codon:yes gene_type:complete
MFNIVNDMKQKKSEFIAFRTTEEIKNMLEELSEKHDRPLSDVIHQLLKSFIKNPPKTLPIHDKE